MKSTLSLLCILLCTIYSKGQNYIHIDTAHTKYTFTRTDNNRLQILVDTISRKEANGGFFYIKITNTSNQNIVIPRQGTCWNDALLISRFIKFPERCRTITPGHTDSIKITWRMGQYKKFIYKSGYFEVRNHSFEQVLQKINVSIKGFIEEEEK